MSLNLYIGGNTFRPSYCDIFYVLYICVRPCCCQQCWETRVGQEMYKLTIFDFIIIAAVTIFVEFPRK